MTSACAPVDSARCPLCGKPNACASEVERATGEPQPPCWCTHVTFGRELLSRVPAPAQGMACVCADCASRASKRPVGGAGTRE